MPGGAHILVQMIAIAVAVGILAQIVADRLRLPSIVFLLLFGVLLGPDVLGWIDTRAFGAGLQAIVAIAVALILFEGGLQLHYLDLAAVGRTVRNLVTIGVVVTVAGASLIAHLVVGFPWPLALLYGAIVSVTGPTVINPLLDRVRVVRRIDTVLRGEGILIDPIGAILAVVVLELVLTTESIWIGFGEFVFRMVAGGAMGLAGGWLLGRVLRLPGLFPPELKNLVVLAWVLALFAAAQAVARESGLAAVVIAGMVVRQESIPQQHLLRRFKGELSILFISLLFILLSAHLPLATLEAVGWKGVLAVVALMWVIRPLNVMASTWKRDLSWREQLFIMWISPRGVVAISIASFIAILLQEGSPEVVRAGLTSIDGEALLALVFLTIAITVVVQGTTAPLVARFLGLRAEEGTYILIVGANRLGRTVANLLANHGWDPLLIDTNGRYCWAARRMGLAAIQGNVLDREVLEQAQVDSAVALLATTSNQEINLIVARLASEEYHVPRVYPVLADVESGAPEGLVEEIGGDLAFGRRMDVVGWSEDLRASRARVATLEVGADAPAETVGELPLPEGAVPVLTVRAGRVLLTHARLRWQPGDQVIAIVRGKGEEALARLLSAAREATVAPAAGP
jgi:NhaP-type Na+/H+ or K+/H+ antiporter/Trk K+ transport system NAD-binding subunit